MSETPRKYNIRDRGKRKLTQKARESLESQDSEDSDSLMGSTPRKARKNTPVIGSGDGNSLVGSTPRKARKNKTMTGFEVEILDGGNVAPTPTKRQMAPAQRMAYDDFAASTHEKLRVDHNHDEDSDTNMEDMVVDVAHNGIKKRKRIRREPEYVEDWVVNLDFSKYSNSQDGNLRSAKKQNRPATMVEHAHPVSASRPVSVSRVFYNPDSLRSSPTQYVLQAAADKLRTVASRLQTAADRLAASTPERPAVDSLISRRKVTPLPSLILPPLLIRNPLMIAAIKNGISLSQKPAHHPSFFSPNPTSSQNQDVHQPLLPNFADDDQTIFADFTHSDDTSLEVSNDGRKQNKITISPTPALPLEFPQYVRKEERSSIGPPGIFKTKLQQFPNPDDHNRPLAICGGDPELEHYRRLGDPAWKELEFRGEEKQDELVSLPTKDRTVDGLCCRQDAGDFTTPPPASRRSDGPHDTYGDREEESLSRSVVMAGESMNRHSPSGEDVSRGQEVNLRGGGLPEPQGESGLDQRDLAAVENVVNSHREAHRSIMESERRSIRESERLLINISKHCSQIHYHGALSYPLHPRLCTSCNACWCVGATEIEQSTYW